MRFIYRNFLTACAAALAVFSVGARAQASEQQQPSYKVTVVPLALGTNADSRPLAFNNAGQMVTSSYADGPTYGHRVSRYGSDGLKDIGVFRNNDNGPAFSINNSGQVAGRLNFGAEYDDMRAIFFDGQNVNDLGTLGGVRSYSLAINDAGQIVGTSETGINYDWHGFLFSGGAMQDLNLTGGRTEAKGINNSGDIVGSFDASTSPTHSERHAFVIRDGVTTDLGKMNGTESWATAINDLGHIIGGVRFPDYSSRAFRYKNGAMSDLGTLGGNYSEATDINALGDVIGQSQTSIQGPWGLASHAFLCGNDGIMRDLGALTGESGESRAIDINDNGQIVGASTLWDGSRAGFVYRDGQMYNLNWLINRETGWSIEEAEFINNSGQIAATGRDANGNTRALLLTPNALPVTVNDTATVVQDSIDNVIRVLDNDTDADNDPLTLTYSPWASNGQVQRTDNNTAVTYTPNAGFVGTDTIYYTASDGSANTQGHVDVTVTANNNGLVADSQSIETNEDTAKAVVLTAQAPSGQTIDSYTVTTQPSHGQLTGTAPNLTYTPETNYNGTDSFAFRAFSGTSGSNIGTVTVSIKPVNDAPVANIQSVTTDEDTAKSITLTASDVDGDALTYSIVSQPSHGILSGTAPVVYYMPSANYNGADSFTFKANDGKVDSEIATISVEVKPVNDPAVAQPKNIEVDEDSKVSFQVVATDIEGDPIRYNVESPPSKGVINNIGANFVYEPRTNLNGTDSFRFSATDTTDDKRSIATISITVRPVNDAPVSSTQSVTTTEDTAKSIVLSANDVDGDALTYSIVTAPTKGTLSGTGTTRTYVPNADFSGTDSFTFKANDGRVDSNVATVNISVTPVNDAPIADAQTVSTEEDTTKNITLSGSDAEGSALTYTVVSNPTRGTLSGTGPHLIYTPNANYNGADSFAFKVNDGTADSATATVSISIKAVNDAPIANNTNITLNEDVGSTYTWLASDGDKDVLTYSIVTPPSHGTASVVGGSSSVNYKPTLNYNGTDSFTFKVNDGTDDSNVATVNITVKPVNDAPVVTPQTLNTKEDTSSPITLSGTDIENDALTFYFLQPAHGTLSGTAPNLVYTPNANYSGTDSFQYRADDGQLSSNIASISINVTSVEDAPVATSRNYTMSEDGGLGFQLSGTDGDGDALTYAVVTQLLHGTLSGTAPNLTYLPHANYNGTDSFTFKANDGKSDSVPATISITITPTNDAPVASPQSVTTNADTAKNITLEATDIDSDPLTYSVVTPPAKGTLSGTAPNLVYTPSLNSIGADSFTFKANDGNIDSNTATVNITVSAVNSAPIASSESVTVNEDLVKNITLSASDANGDALTYSIVTSPTKGTLSGSGASRVYTPNANFNGSDSFSYKANDGKSDSNIATIAITVTPVNDVPVASAQSVTTAEDTVKSITLTASDVDGDTLSYSIVTPPTKGTLSGSGAARTYTPNADSNGSDSFSFKANDGTVDSNTATVNITVTPTNDAPTSSTQSVTTNEDTAKTITLAASDVDGDALTYSIVAAPTKGTLSGSGANRVYTPNANFNGTDSFSFKANDGTSDSNTATVSITVAAVNDAPVAVNDASTTKKNTAKLIPVLVNDTDVDGDTLSIASVTAGANGAVAISGTSVNFTPARNFVGNASFSYTVKDTKGGTATASVTVTVTK